MNYKHIAVGLLIKNRVAECGIESSRICNFFKLSEKEIEEMYELMSIDSHLLLKWSKLLDYDFFRIYTQHLILYAPLSNIQSNVHSKETPTSRLPQFRKNIYTTEIIDFIMELLETGEKTKLQIIQEYRIPKTTLYKWIEKHNKHGKAGLQ